jgi:hypothetical protein
MCSRVIQMLSPVPVILAGMLQCYRCPLLPHTCRCTLSLLQFPEIVASSFHCCRCWLLSHIATRHMFTLSLSWHILGHVNGAVIELWKLFCGVKEKTEAAKSFYSQVQETSKLSPLGKISNNISRLMRSPCNMHVVILTYKPFEIYLRSFL